MAKFCPECGTAYTGNEKFCTNCGAPVPKAAPVSKPEPEPVKSAVPAAAEPKNRGDFPEPKKKETVQGKGKRILCVILAIILLAELAVAGFACPGFLKKNPEEPNPPETAAEPKPAADNDGSAPQARQDAIHSKVSDETSAVVTAENSVVTLGGVTVDANPLNLIEESQTVEVITEKTEISEDGTETVLYDISMGEHHQLAAPVKLTFPCSTSEDVTVSVEHYVEELGWIPLNCDRNTENGTVTVLTDSLSPLKKKETKNAPTGLFYVNEPGSWNATLEISSNYMEILKNADSAMLKNESNRFLSNPEAYAIEMPSLEDTSTIDGMKAAYSKASNIWTVMGPVTELYTAIPLDGNSQKKIVQFMDKFNPLLGNAINYVPFAMMAIQAGLDCYRDGTLFSEEAAVNGYKNIMTNANGVYWLHTGYGHFGYTLTFAAVAVFSMELDAIVDAAKEEQAKNRASVYESYYKNVRPFEPNEWYDMFTDAYWKGNGNSKKAMDTIREKVDEYVNVFWTDVYDTGNDELIFAAEAAGLRNVYMNATSKEKDELSTSMKYYVWGRIEKEVMPWIGDFLEARLQEDTYKSIAPIAKPYNQTLHFDILETVDMNTSVLPKYLGHTICIGSGGKPVSDWYQTIPDEDDLTDGWEYVFDCTVYGWMSYGMPEEILIYKNASDIKDGKEPVRVVPFEAVTTGDYTTVINLSATDTIAWGLRSVTCEYYSPGDSETAASGTKTEKPVSTYVDEDGFEFVYFLGYSLTGSRYYYADIGTMPGIVVDWEKEFKLNITSYAIGGYYGMIYVNGKLVPGDSATETDGRHAIDDMEFAHFEPDYSFFDGTGLVATCDYDLSGYLPECTRGTQVSVRIEMTNMRVTYTYIADAKSEVEQWKPDIVCKEVNLDTYLADRWAQDLDSHR